MSNQKHDVEALVKFEFARLAREVLGLRCVARLVDGISGDAQGAWFDVQSDVGRARVLERDRGLQEVLIRVAYRMRDRGAIDAAWTLAASSGNSMNDWCETVAARMAESQSGRSS